MAFKSITPTSPINSDDDQLPLVADYVKANKQALGQSFPVLSVALSRSGQWMMIDTECFRAMFNIKSAEAKALLKFFPTINNCEADMLAVVPIKGKKGITVMVGADDSDRKEYVWTGEELMILNLGESSCVGVSTELTAENFQAKPLSKGKSTSKKKTTNTLEVSTADA